jgi:hypothetical protein
MLIWGVCQLKLAFAIASFAKERRAFFSYLLQIVASALPCQTKAAIAECLPNEVLFPTAEASLVLQKEYGAMPLQRQGLAQRYLDCAIEAIRRAQGAKNRDMRARQRKIAAHYLALAAACGYESISNSHGRARIRARH